MPTVNQLVRKGRTSSQKRTKAPALRVVQNTLKNKITRGPGCPQRGTPRARTWTRRGRGIPP